MTMLPCNVTTLEQPEKKAAANSFIYRLRMQQLSAVVYLLPDPSSLPLPLLLVYISNLLRTPFRTGCPPPFPKQNMSPIVTADRDMETGYMYLTLFQSKIFLFQFKQF